MAVRSRAPAARSLLHLTALWEFCFRAFHLWPLAASCVHRDEPRERGRPIPSPFPRRFNPSPFLLRFPAA
eukprot:scaffold151488_cov33-Tisochrysis_lutea.AAC.2